MKKMLKFGETWLKSIAKTLIEILIDIDLILLSSKYHIINIFFKYFISFANCCGDYINRFMLNIYWITQVKYRSFMLKKKKRTTATATKTKIMDIPWKNLMKHRMKWRSYKKRFWCWSSLQWWINYLN